MTCEPWPIRWACDITDEDPALLALAQEAAQGILWSLSGRRVGVCSQVEQYRPACEDRCFGPWDWWGPGVEWRLGYQPRYCCRLPLEQKPVRAIHLIEVDGVPLDPSGYVLERDSVLRLGACWPCGGMCELAPIEITYSWGIDPPPLAELAMGELACEILRGLTGADCRLPSNAIAVTRQGITVDLGDAATLWEQNRVGLPLSDLFIRQMNPGRLVSQSKVWTPDAPRRVR